MSQEITVGDFRHNYLFVNLEEHHIHRATQRLYIHRDYYSRMAYISLERLNVIVVHLEFI